MLKVLFVLGTRPEAIKMAPVIKEFRKYPHKISCRVCVTSQHKEMLIPFLKLFKIRKDYDLNIMHKKQSLEYITSTVLSQMGYIFEKYQPHYVFVQGDTSTALAASLAAYYNKIKVGHIEAGLRTGNKHEPFPEEINRVIIDDIADLYFAHTFAAKKNLLKEGVKNSAIEVTGNTVIDSLLDVAQKKFDFRKTILKSIVNKNKKIILITAHRRESFGKPLKNICQAIKVLANRYPEIHFVFPVHLNPAVQKTVYPILANSKNVFLIKPLDYVTFIHLMKRSFLVLTDSGGVQEEAPTLHKPVLVLRDKTERPEALKTGATFLVGTNQRVIINKTIQLIENRETYRKMSTAKNPYGDGKASQRILQCILRERSHD